MLLRLLAFIKRIDTRPTSPQPSPAAQGRGQEHEPLASSLARSAGEDRGGVLLILILILILLPTSSPLTPREKICLHYENIPGKACSCKAASIARARTMRPRY